MTDSAYGSRRLVFVTSVALAILNACTWMLLYSGGVEAFGWPTVHPFVLVAVSVLANEFGIRPSVDYREAVGATSEETSRNLSRLMVFSSAWRTFLAGAFFLLSRQLS